LYEAHFGLRGRPFGETLSLTSYVALPSRESVSRRLRYGLEHGQGPAIVFGPPGTGKTLLVRALARDLDVPTAHLTFPAMPAAELLDLVAEELGAGAGGGSSVLAALRRLRPWLSAAVVRGGRPLVVVDEAHLIDDPATFEALRLLLNFATAGPPDISLLLVGGPEMLLRIPTGLADRLTARCLVGPLSESESSAYVLGRIAASGVDEPLFAAEALDALHRAADGLPRRLNRLADLALLIAYAQGLSRPDTHAVATAARELDLDGLAA
jgi:type II secretory pathway predicted ATPase ExeA